MKRIDRWRVAGAGLVLVCLTAGAQEKYIGARIGCAAADRRIFDFPDRFNPILGNLEFTAQTVRTDAACFACGMHRLR